MVRYLALLYEIHLFRLQLAGDMLSRDIVPVPDGSPDDRLLGQNFIERRRRRQHSFVRG